MRRVVLVVPGLLSHPEGDSFLRQKLPALSILTEIGDLCKVARLPQSETPEAMLLGLGPSQVVLRQGPLTVSAFGFDPPERSTHFHLSLMSFTDGVVTSPAVLPTPEEVDVLLGESKRLSTKLLTVLKGEALDHALVWEARGDFETFPTAVVQKEKMSKHLPNGDGDVALRRLIDDSINLLSSLDLNARRIDEGLSPFNLLWPWGHGERTSVPNLALRRGEPGFVESSSLRLAGLTRLAAYKHADRHAFGIGLQTKLRAIAGRALGRELTIAYVEAPADLRARNKPEELEWFVRELDRELVQPLLDDVIRGETSLSLIAPGPFSFSNMEALPASDVGLSLGALSGTRKDNPFPFDERSLEEKKVPSTDLWTIVEQAVADSSQMN